MKSKIIIVATALGCMTMAQAFAQGVSTTTVETSSVPGTAMNTTTVYSENRVMPGTAAAGNMSRTETFETKDRSGSSKIKKAERKVIYNNQVDIALPHIAE